MQVAMIMRDFSEAHKLDVESVLDLQTRRKIESQWICAVVDGVVFIGDDVRVLITLARLQALG